MTNRIVTRIEGEERVVASLGRVATQARIKVKRKFQMLGFMLTSHIQRTKLTGQRLNQRTGRLVGSVHEETVESEASVTTTVGTNVHYARPHEYGIRGSVQVKAHMRTIKQAFGRPIAPRQVMVRAHPMRMDITEKRMFRDSLIEFQPTINTHLEKLAEELAQEVTTR